MMNKTKTTKRERLAKAKRDCVWKTLNDPFYHWISARYFENLGVIDEADDKFHNIGIQAAATILARFHQDGKCVRFKLRCRHPWQYALNIRFEVGPFAYDSWEERRVREMRGEEMGDDA